MRYVIVQHNCDTVPHPLLIYDADSEYHPGERPKALFLLLPFPFLTGFQIGLVS